MKTAGKYRVVPALVAAVILAAAYGVGGSAASGQDAPTGASAAPADPESARAAVSKWVGTQQIIFKERRDWQQGKEVLQARIDLLRKEIAQLEEKLAESRSGATEVDQRKAALEAEIGSLKQTADALGAAVSGLEADLRRLRGALPAPLLERIAPLYERMPEGAAQSKISLAERFQNVLGILNEINRINGEITLATEIRALAGGRPSEVKTVYVGLGQAYFLSPRGDAGVGRPTPEGWVWEPADALAHNVAEVIDILQSKGTPKFVPLPVQIQ
jgi:hypothetical protein